MAKTKYKADYWASVATDENYGTIFVGMLKSQAFKALSPNAKNLYVVLRAHSKDKKAKQALYKFCEANKIEQKQAYENRFLFTTKQAAEYGYTAPNKSRYIKELEESGFIKIVISGYEKRKANMYEFSGNWKKITPKAGDAFGVDELD